MRSAGSSFTTVTADGLGRVLYRASRPPARGAGRAEDVHWAVNVTGLCGALDICDAGCGPGADLEVLAEALPDARLTGIEAQESFVSEAAGRCARFGDRVAVRLGDMAKPAGPYDLIWCAGALYFLGVTEGLTAWRSALKPGGRVAFSEPVLLPGPQPDAVADFWEDYPAITELEGIVRRVHDAGYQVVDQRMIVGAPWAAYYAPLKERIATLRADTPSPALTAMLDETEREIRKWEAAPDHIAYALLVVHPA